MEIIEKTFDDDENAQYRIEVNGKTRIRVSDGGEPEDNKLCRDLDFVYEIVELMKEAHEAGKNGEPFVVKQEEIKPE